MPDADDVTVEPQGELVLATPNPKDALVAFLVSLLSRKFLASVVLAFGLFQQKRYWEAAAVIGGYSTLEGAADILERKERAKPSTPIVEHATNVNVEPQDSPDPTPRPRRPRRAPGGDG